MTKSTANELSQVEQELAALNKRKAELEKTIASMTPEKILAEKLHEKFCTWNHTDGCGWFYDRGDWTEHSRQSYLKQASSIIGTARNLADGEVSVEILMNFFNLALEKMRP